jgi:hypothetical protein
MATAVELVARYPEFAPAVSAYPDMVDACLAEAGECIDATFFAGKTQYAVLALAAHLIAINPLGELARIDKRSDATVYSIQFERLKRMCCAGFRVI